MRYERSAFIGDPKIGARRRWIAIIATTLVLVGGTIGVVLATDSADPPPKAADRPAIESAFLTANVFLENIGSPAPVGATNPAWALHSIPLIGSGSHAHLASIEHRWIDADGNVALLSSQEASALTAAQMTLIDGLFVGALRTQVIDELRQIVRQEQHSVAMLPSPGGAKVTQWISVTEKGDHATAEAIVSQWVQQDTVTGTSARPHVKAAVILGAVDATATLVRVHGAWRLQSLRQPPWQQAT